MYPTQAMMRIAEQPDPEPDGVWLSVCVIPRPGGGAEVRVAGEIDLDNAAQLRGALLVALDTCPGGVSLDLSAVTFCDCSGLNVLLRARRHAADRHRGFRIGAVSRPVRRLLELTQTAPLFDGGGQTVSAV